MKNIILIIGMVVFASCNSGETSSNSTETTTNEKPTAIQDSGTQHATGITNSNVISTDTSQFDVKPLPKDTSKK